MNVSQACVFISYSIPSYKISLVGIEFNYDIPFLISVKSALVRSQFESFVIFSSHWTVFM